MSAQVTGLECTAAGELAEETGACGTHYIQQYTAEVTLTFRASDHILEFVADVDTLMLVAQRPPEDLALERLAFPAWDLLYRPLADFYAPPSQYQPTPTQCAEIHAKICSMAQLLLYWGWPTSVRVLEEAALIKSPLNLAFARWLLEQRRVVVGRAVKPFLSRPRKGALPS